MKQADADMPTWRIENTCQGRKWYVYRNGRLAAGFDHRWEADDYVAGTYTDSQCYGCWLFSQPEWKVFDAAAQKKDQAAFQRQAPRGTWS